MHRYLKFAFAIVIGCLMVQQSSVALESNNLRIVIHSVTGQPSEKNGHAVTFLATEVVQLIKNEGINSLVKSFEVKDYKYLNETLWIVPNQYLAEISAFKPLKAWHGEKHYEVGAGDYYAVYDLKPDGTFIFVQSELTVTKDGADSYKNVSYFGRLYKAGNVIWARRKNIKSDSIRYENYHMFWLKPDGTFCHPLLEGCEDKKPAKRARKRAGGK